MKKYMQVLELYKLGHTNEEMVKILNTTAVKIRSSMKYLREKGLIDKSSIRDYKSAGHTWSEDDTNILIRKRLELATVQEIASELALTHAQVSNKIKKLVKANTIEPLDWEVGLSRIKYPGGIFKDVPTILYMLEFYELGFYKIGITQQGIAKRFHGAPKYKILYSLELKLQGAKELEYELKQLIKPIGDPPPWFYRNGRTECFRDNFDLVTNKIQKYPLQSSL